MDNVTDLSDIITTKQNNVSDIVDDPVSSQARTLHNVCATTVAISGFISNLLTIAAILKSRFAQQTGIIFTLNLIGNNFLACAISLPIISARSFMNDVNFTHGECVLAAYILYSTVGSELLALMLISLNRYFLIVHLDIYKKLYDRRRNIIIMILISWLVYPILLLFPASEKWGAFLYDKNRFSCHPFMKDDGFGTFLTLFALITTFPPLIYTYLAVVYKVWSSRRKINTMRTSSKTVESQERDKLRNKHDMQLVMTVILILTTFGILYVPFLTLSLIDPKMTKYNILIHITSIYLGWLHCLINPLLYSILNSYVKTACRGLFCCKPSESPIDQISVHVTVNVGD